MTGKYWQAILDKLILLATINGDLRKIQRLSSEEGLIKFFMNGRYRDCLLEWIDETISSPSWLKCKEKAKCLRNEGNKQFQKQLYENCLRTYSDSIKYAPIRSEELSLSLANRSAALVHLNKFKEALKDIKLAFHNGYPKNLQYKLHQRKGYCLMQLGKFQRAIVEFRLAQDALKDVDIPHTKKFEISEAIQKAVFSSMAQLHTYDNRVRCNETEDLQFPVVFGGVSEDFASASSALSVQTSETKGRHVVALEDISVGDILFVEKPFVFVLLPEHYQDRCHHCCNLFKAPVPCQVCSQVLYCNELCRKDAWNEYHKWECFGGLNIVHSVGVAHLGLRVVLKAGTLLEHKSSKRELFLDKIERKNDYFAVYHLLTHLEIMSPEDRAAYALTAVCLLLYLVHHTDYFTQDATVVSVNEDLSGYTDDHLMIGGLILHHICQLVCNGHAITAVQDAKPDLEENDTVVDQKQVRIATAIFPSACMMNHSCDSNIINSFWGTYLIVKAYKNIKNGEEVCNCYGPNFRRMRRQERKESLKAQYHFECMCEACVNDNEFLEKFSSLLCSNCQDPLLNKNVIENDIVCSNCGSCFNHTQLLVSSKKSEDLFQQGCELLDHGSISEALRQMLSSHAIQKTCLYQSNIQHRACLDGIAKCYALLGDYNNSILYLLKTLPAIEEQFGLWSIEMAHEMQKLTDLMIGDLSNDSYDKDTFLKKYAEAQKQVKKTKEIFQLHYGTWNESLQEVEKKSKTLDSILNFLHA